MQPIDAAWNLLRKGMEGDHSGADLLDYINQQAGAMPEEKFRGDEQSVRDISRLLELAAIQNTNPELTQMPNRPLSRAKGMKERGYQSIRDLPEYGSSEFPIGDRSVKRSRLLSQGYQTE